MVCEYHSLLQAVEAGQIEPERALLGAVLVRAHLDASGVLGCLESSAVYRTTRDAVREQISAEARGWIETVEYRAALEILGLDGRER